MRTGPRNRVEETVLFFFFKRSTVCSGTFSTAPGTVSETLACTPSNALRYVTQRQTGLPGLIDVRLLFQPPVKIELPFLSLALL